MKEWMKKKEILLFNSYVLEKLFWLFYTVYSHRITVSLVCSYVTMTLGILFFSQDIYTFFFTSSEENTRMNRRTLVAWFFFSHLGFTVTMFREYVTLDFHLLASVDSLISFLIFFFFFLGNSWKAKNKSFLYFKLFTSHR